MSQLPSTRVKAQKQPKPVIVDFETEGIVMRKSNRSSAKSTVTSDWSDYPPIPVGVSIKWPGKKPRYYAWGHPTKNNCNEIPWAELKKAWVHPDGLAFQNGKFDVEVARVHLDMPVPAWDKIHDTLFLLFLDDPHQLELGLKPSSERLLGLPPEEQDAVGDWLIEHQPVPNVKISRSKSSEHYFGRYICLAPGDLVGEYANGDTIRTEKLFNLLWKKTQTRSMLGAYDRERQLMPMLLDMERQGVPVDLPKLKRDVKMYSEWLERLNTWVKTRLKVIDPEFNLDSGEQLVKAMLAAGAADPKKMPLTLTGKYQTNKEALLLGVTDKVLLAVLKYRTQLKTCLSTFMSPWLGTAIKSGGLIFTSWNQVKTPSGDANVGTRTGRLSSTPNFQNIPKEFLPIFFHEAVTAAAKALKLPKSPFKDLPPLPNVRSYIVAFPGEVLIDRDYSQQEPRILAHFDGGALMKKYLEDPWIDFHDFAQVELAKMGLHYERKPVKNTNLGLIYGMGVGKLAAKNNMPVDEARDLKMAILSLYPGLKAMYSDMKARARAGTPIRTWGGREYYCEAPKIIDGRLRQFDYKLVNVLIQGSAADCTKEAILKFYQAKRKSWKLLLNVHDELLVSAPRSELKPCMKTLQDCMEGIPFDVAMLTEGSTSTKNLASLKPYDKKGVVL